MVSSLDGFIAKKDGDMSWFETTSPYEKGVDGEDPEEFMKTIDCFVIGSNTYELTQKVGWPYGDTPTMVVTHRNLNSDRKTVQFYSGDLTQLVNTHLKPKYQNIWLAGGAQLVKDFLQLNLADNIRLTILPIILGDGLPFLDHIGRELPLQLKNVTAYKNGMVEVWYGVD